MSVLTRRLFLGTAASVAFAQKKTAAPERPNIVLIVASDLPGWLLGCYGNKEVRTPNIDLLARGGARFAESFTSTPAGAPSRATLFTGRTPRQHGILQDMAKDVPPAFNSEVMLSDILAGAGYNCGYIGRWDLGGNEQPGHHFELAEISRGNSDSEAEAMTRQAAGYIDKQSAAKPFFLTLSYRNDGHPKKYDDMYAKSSLETLGFERPAANAVESGKQRMKDLLGNARKVAASVTALDDQLGLLVNKLIARGLRDNTIVIFTSDNGALLGRHGLYGSGLASNPINMFDESIGVPMIWNWPGRIPVQSVRPELVSLYDVVPTLCAITGIASPDRNLCGRSYQPLLFNHPLPKKQPWRQTVFAQLGNTEMARDPRFKLVLRNSGEGPNELFDVRADPRERVNLYESLLHVTVRDLLASELEAWRKKYA